MSAFVAVMLLSSISVAFCLLYPHEADADLDLSLGYGTCEPRVSARKGAGMVFRRIHMPNTQ